MPRIAKTIARVLVWTITAYVTWCAVLFLFQRQIMFPTDEFPPTGVDPPKIAGMEPVWIDIRKGRTETWFFPPVAGTSRGPAPAVIFAHGNAELIDHWPFRMTKLTEFGAALLLVEYPGYGRSSGSPSEATITETFVAAYDMLAKRKDVDPARIVLMGRSLGGGAVCRLARERPPAAIILMSAFTSVRDLAGRYAAPGWLVRDPFDNLAVVEKHPGPVAVFHGEHDPVVPFRHGEILADAAPNGQFFAYPCGHNDFPHDWNVFWRDVRSFLTRSGILPGQPAKNVRSTSSNSG